MQIKKYLKKNLKNQKPKKKKKKKIHLLLATDGFIITNSRHTGERKKKSIIEPEFLSEKSISREYF